MVINKKPPMEITEDIEEEVNEEGKAKPGSLSYGGKPIKVVRRGSNEGSGPKFSLTTAVAGAFLGLIFAAGIIAFSSASKVDIQTLNTQLISTREALTKAEALISADSAKISNLINSQGDYAKKAELGTLATRAELTAINLSSYALKSQIPEVTGYDTKTSVDGKIKVLQDQIDKLKLTGTTSDGTLVTAGQVKSSFSISNWVPTSYTPIATSRTYQLPFKLTITNGLNKDISNLQMFLSMYSSYLGPGASATLTSLSGGTWSSYTTSASTFYFTNTSGMSGWGGTGMTVGANSSKTITLIFTYTAPAAADGTPINFGPDLASITSGDYTIN